MNTPMNKINVIHIAHEHKGVKVLNIRELCVVDALMRTNTKFSGDGS